MSGLSLKELRGNLSDYIKKSTPKALIICLADFSIYLAAICGVILFDNILLKFICSCLIGLKMASLFVIAHDAAHDNFFNNSLLNRVIGRLAFLPCYHNYSLWLIVHNRFHHQFTNMKGLNSWSPLSKNEYDSLPSFKKGLEQLYRSPLGISFNYLVERWWKNKFFPFKKLTGNFQGKYWFDFLLVSLYLTAQVCFFIYVGVNSASSSVIEMMTLGLFWPLFVFAFMVGFSVYQQHTHETVPWFDDNDERKIYGHTEDVTLHVKYPGWYNILSHNVMEHTAHHIDPRIPSYNLAKAQQKIEAMYFDSMKIMKFSLRETLLTMEKCKLYDYENHYWLDFDGNKTSEPIIFEEEIAYLDVA